MALRRKPSFWRGALDQYGIGVQVLRAGRYKSAIEPFVRTENSPEEEAQLQALLSDLWQTVLQTVAESRDATTTQLQQVADDGGIVLASEAEQLDLVDRTAYYDDILTDLQVLTDSEADAGEDIPSIDLVSYSNMVADEPGFGSRDVIAVVYAEGDILFGEGGGRLHWFR
jgi:protease-4